MCSNFLFALFIEQEAYPVVPLLMYFIQAEEVKKCLASNFEINGIDFLIMCKIVSLHCHLWEPVGIFMCSAIYYSVKVAVTVYNIEEAPYTKRKRVVFMPACTIFQDYFYDV